MRYVDGFVLPVPEKNLQAYCRMAQKAGKIWREHGALDYKECAGDDLKAKGTVSFPRTVKLKRGEKVFFSWIVYKSRARQSRQCQSNEGPAARKDDGSEGHAL